MYTKNTYNALKNSNLEICKKLARIIGNEETFKKIGANKINTIINNYISSFNSKGEQISFEHDYELKRDFRFVIRIAFGEHAYKIINERPNLSFHNISDFRAFDKKFFDVMGENFVHQMLNFNYNELKFAKDNYNDLIDTMLKSKIYLDAFKYCFDFITEKQKEVYDYARLFNTFSKYHALFVDCYIHKDELSKEQINMVKNVIVNPLNDFKIDKVQDLSEYDMRVEQFYAKKLKGKESVEKYASAILERFFGIYSSYKYADNSFKRSNFSIEVLLHSYNIDRIISLEENPDKFNYTKMLNDEELATLKLISAVGHIIKHSKNGNQKDCIQLLKNLYQTLADAEKENDATKQILQPRDVRKVILKISDMYKDDLKDKLNGIRDFEKAVLNGESGIRVEYVKARTYHGKKIRIPVYHLEGYKYNVLVTCTQEALTAGRNTGYDDERPETLNKIKQREYNVEQSRKLVKMWFEKENGSGHISCSYDSYFGMGSIETLGIVINGNDKDKKRQATYLIPKSTRIISMGSEDVYSTAKNMDADPSTCVLCTSFRKAYDLSARTFTDFYNEIVTDRYTIDSVKRASKIVPEALFKSGKEPDEMIIEHAVAMTEYLIENGLKPINYVFPIVMVDRSMYASPSQNETFKYHKNLSFDLDYLRDIETSYDYASRYIGEAISAIDENRSIGEIKIDNIDDTVIDFDD